MTEETMIGENARQEQTIISESNNETDAVRAVEVAPTTAPEQGEVEIPDLPVDQIDEETDEDVEDEFRPRSFREILEQTVGETNVVRLVIRPELNFVVNLFADEFHSNLCELASYEYNDQKLNVIQPLSKKNDRSGRIGVLREPLRNFVDTIQGAMQNEERVVVTPETGSLVLDNLVNEFMAAAEATLYENFPRVEGVPAIEVGDDLIDAHEYVRLRSLATADTVINEGETPVVVATVKFIVHLRLPLLIRQDSSNFEKTLKLHFKYLENCGIKAGMPTSIYAGFYSQDLVNANVLNCFNWIRENGADVEILSYRNLESGGDFFGIQGFDEDAYEDALFNGGDFLVAFNIEKEGE